MFFACIHINYAFPASKLHCTKELTSHTNNSVPTPSCLFLSSFKKQSRSTVRVCACIGVCSLDLPTYCLVFMKFGTYVPIIDNNNKASLTDIFRLFLRPSRNGLVYVKLHQIVLLLRIFPFIISVTLSLFATQAELFWDLLSYKRINGLTC
jgi:hypothetical protein